jgi:hypothetical protein
MATTKKEPQDRRPKAQQRVKPDAEKSVDREVVSTGLDFRPIPIEAKGIIWYLDPDPSPDQMETLRSAASGFKKTEGSGEESEDEEVSEESAKETANQLKEATEGLEKALVGVLLEPDQKKEFPGSYGMFGVQNIAMKYLEMVSGFPTK